MKKLAVGGHSSGGYLAAFLLTYYPEHITKGLLLYPVTDLGFLLHELSEGGLYDNQLLDSRSAFYSFISLKVSHTGQKIFDKDLVKLLNGFRNSVKNTLLRSVLIETEISEKVKVLKFFKPYMKVLNLDL